MEKVAVFWDYDDGWLEHNPKEGWHPKARGYITRQQLIEYQIAKGNLHKLEIEIRRDMEVIL